MNTVNLFAFAAIFLVVFGMLIGCTLSEIALNARTRRQAAVQRALNAQRQELEAARRTMVKQRTGESSTSVRC
ncbi:MAG: hypothetical protein QOI89_3381 [Solirubrobacteraceae bacterium]|jgi:uncharacterized membrane-anchored protein YhcB (DUF1043 family)|nr:hypothetical protein [Solirubrobacteraceae bacterium]